jgi:hypothetical protein
MEPTREELYRRVWETPMRKLAPHFGLSDVGLKKVCKRYDVPTPPLGYWAKKEFGKPVKQPRLPGSWEEATQVVSLHYNPAPQPPEAPPTYPVQDADLVELIKYERDPANRIVVSDHLRNPHPLIHRTRDALAEAGSPDEHGLIGPLYPVCEECIHLAVSQASVPRALRLMNSLLLALERRGHRVDVPARNAAGSYRHRVHCVMLDQEFSFYLREKTRMVYLPQQAGSRSLFDPRVRFEPKGELELRIPGGYRHTVGTWSDGKKTRLEDRLNDVVIALVVEIQHARRRREEAEREEQRRIVAERERQERERLEQLERARISHLETCAERWEKAARLRAFLAAVREESMRRRGSTEASDELRSWLEWADTYVEALDPLSPCHTALG